MRLYRCEKYDADCGQLLSWHRSQRDAERELRRHQRERSGPPVGPEGVYPVDIPTDRAGLVSWLNAYFNSDNG